MRRFRAARQLEQWRELSEARQPATTALGYGTLTQLHARPNASWPRCARSSPAPVARHRRGARRGARAVPGTGETMPARSTP